MNVVIKTAAVIITVLGGGYLGRLAASYYTVRTAQIEQFEQALTQLEFSIVFLKLSTACALSRAGKSRCGAVSSVLTEASDDIASLKKTPSEAWEDALNRNKSRLCITREDAEILMRFAENLGGGDTESERNNIRAACARLGIAKQSAKAESERMCRLLKGMGMLGGMLVSVLLF